MVYSIPVGKNKLAELMKTMAARAGLQKPLTNHSLRAYGVTKMFQAKVPEKLIMERSGHRSTDGVCQYERTAEGQVVDVCKALSKRETTASSVVPPQRTNTTAPVFSGCTFNNCTFQVMQALPQPPETDVSGVNITELFSDF